MTEPFRATIRRRRRTALVALALAAGALTAGAAAGAFDARAGDDAPPTRDVRAATAIEYGLIAALIT